MSTFRRTSSGLNNQHLFYNVDLIVFVEGGAVAYNKVEAYAGRFTEETEDVIFWNGIFSKFVTNKKFKFKSIGSKSVIKEIALDIVSGQLKTVLVAMDNEFDEILKNRIDHERVFYTHGYSFENDIWNEDVVKSIIEDLTAVDIIDNSVSQNFNKFIKDMKIAVYADGYLFKKGTSFLPRRSGHLFCVDCNPVDLPSIKKDAIEQRLIDKSINKKNVYSFGSRHTIDVHKYCYGHLLADYCYQLISHYIRKRHYLNNIPKDVIYRLGIRNFFRVSFDGSSIFQYYQTQFSNKTSAFL